MREQWECRNEQSKSGQRETDCLFHGTLIILRPLRQIHARASSAPCFLDAIYSGVRLGGAAEAR